MTLRPGRMEGIIDNLKSDHSVFPCHKTTHRGEEGEDGNYAHSGDEQACMGALAYMLYHHGQLPVLARLAIRAGETSIDQIEANFTKLEEPGKWPTR